MLGKKSIKFRRGQSMPDVFKKVVDVLFLGAAGVGKTSLVRRLLDREFMEDYIPTVYDVVHKDVVSDTSVLSFQITDMSGYYSFPPMRRIAISRTNIFVLVYEIGNKKSYNEVQRLKDEILELKELSQVRIITVGNKTDRVKYSCVKDVEKEDDVVASSYAKLKVSAKTGDSVFLLLQALLDASNEQCSPLGVKRRQLSQSKASRSLKVMSIKW